MYNEWFRTLQKDIYSLKFQRVQLKWIISHFTSLKSHLYVNIHPPRNDAEQQVLTQQFLTTFTQQVFLPFGFLENT